MAKKEMTIKVDKENVMHTGISKSKSGYNSAYMSVKLSEDEYMSVNFDWQGDMIPGFVMDLMGFMQSSLGTQEGMEEAWQEYSAKKKETCAECGKMKEECKCKPKAASKKKEMCETCKKPMEECKCDPKKASAEDEEAKKGKMNPKEDMMDDEEDPEKMKKGKKKKC